MLEVNLIQASCAVHAKRVQGWCGTAWAAQNGHIDVCKLMIKTVQNKNPVDRFGRTPFILARDYGHESICRMMMSYEDFEKMNVTVTKTLTATGNSLLNSTYYNFV